MIENAGAAGPGFVATAARGLEPVLAEELNALGGETALGRGAVECSGDWQAACRAALWSRVASRILWPVAELEATDAAALYDQLLAHLTVVERLLQRIQSDVRLQ